MSLITRCPACQTMFRVVPDQLRISDGWVRCGQCEEIFDASLNLLPNQPTGESIPPRVEPPQEAVNEFVAMPDDAVVEHPAVQVFMPESPDEPLPPDDAEFIEPTITSQAPPDQWPQPLRQSEVPESVDDALVESEPMPDRMQDSPSAITPDLDVASDQSMVREVAQQDESVEPEVSFLKTGTGHAFWGRTSVRWTMALLALILLFGLALQVLVHERNRIVAIEPGMKPWLQGLCDVMDCTLSPLRRIESIVIESSSFARVRGESHRLSFVLKNSSDIALALPSMELTLTDAQDQVVTRRVFEPSELGATATVLMPSAEWSGAATFAVDTGSKTERVAGYRLLAFYP